MQAKQSSTASGMYRRSEPITAPVPLRAAAMGHDTGALYTVPPPRGAGVASSSRHRSRAGLRTAQDAGLLHDARNLMGAIELYCDLLSMPGVLQQKHRHYVEDLRLLGSRSGRLIQSLIEQPRQLPASQAGLWRPGKRWGSSEDATDYAGALERRRAKAGPADIPQGLPGSAHLRAVVERCAGLLSRVAGGKTVEVSYGPAATVPVTVDEEAVERILVNLVRNAAAALGAPTAKLASDAALGAVVERSADRTADETPGSIRIGVGLVANRADDPRPWPLRRVRLTVEDSGCGMSAEQLERMQLGNRAPSRGGHGIGFRVVRDLVADSCGDLRVMSAPGVGTRVQIEWPVAACILHCGPCDGMAAVEGKGSIC